MAESIPCPTAASHINMQNGTFSSSPGVTFNLRHFVATLTPMGKRAPDCYGKYTEVSQGEIFVSSESLTKLFSAKIANSSAKISNLSIRHTAEGAILTGKLDKLIPIFFTISGPVSTNGKEIRMDAKTIKADGIPVKALMGMVGEHLNSMLKLKGMAGIQVEDNSLAFSPEAVAHLRGHIASVSTSPTGLTLRYGPAQTAKNTPAQH